MCGNGQESVALALVVGSSAITQTKYLERHNCILRILFFRDSKQIHPTPKRGVSWYKWISPKPVYENEELEALWDVHLFAEQVDVQANCIDAQVTDKVKKEVIQNEIL